MSKVHLQELGRTGVTNLEATIAAETLVAVCHGLARESGWWTATDSATSKDNPLHFSNKLMLIVSEVAEAMEGDRKSRMDDHLPNRPMREVELADAVIRIFDLAGGYNLDIAGAIVEKMEYNMRRSDHKIENRKADSGKAY